MGLPDARAAGKTSGSTFGWVLIWCRERAGVALGGKGERPWEPLPATRFPTSRIAPQSRSIWSECEDGTGARHHIQPPPPCTSPTFHATSHTSHPTPRPTECLHPLNPSPQQEHACVLMILRVLMATACSWLVGWLVGWGGGGYNHQN